MLFINADTHWKSEPAMYSLPVLFDSENQNFSLCIWDMNKAAHSIHIQHVDRFVTGEVQGEVDSDLLPAEHSAIRWGPVWLSLLQGLPTHWLHIQTSSMNYYIILVYMII